MSWAWAKVADEHKPIGVDFDTFTKAVAALPEGSLWRHNQAGDLPGENNTIDQVALRLLVEANEGRKGFTYTHKPVGPRGIGADNAEAIEYANAMGFTVNLSADTLAEADELSALNIGPVVVVQDAVDGERADTVTPGGRKVATCPATYRDDISCGGGMVKNHDGSKRMTSRCGLCQRQDRKVIIGFPAHGSGAKKAAAVARG